MALSSAINPEVITRTKKPNFLGAQNFISGDSKLRTGIVQSASNKIVNFQRRGIQPSSTDTSSIVKTISTNVVTSYNNQAQSINSSVTNLISKTISNLSKEYQEKIKSIDEAKPTGVLQKILGLYKDVIQFIQFFGKKQFVDKLRDNLKALQKSFTDSFDVAKIIRQTIVKIVKQLSNLPKTTPSGGGGLNLDVDIPGPGLKRTAPRGANRMMRRGMRRGKMFALGAGVLGAGALGGAAVNALQDGMIQPGEAAPEIPGNLIDGLSSIIDRFSRAIDNLVKGGSGKKSSSSSSSSSGASGASGGSAPGNSPPDPGSSGPNVSSAPGEQKLAAFISTLESTGEQNQSDVLQSMFNRAGQNYSGYGGLFGQLTHKNQYSPLSAIIHGTTDPNAQRIYGPIADKLGKNPQERIAKIKEIISDPDALKKLQNLYGGSGSASGAARILNDALTGGPLSKNSRTLIGGRTDFGATPGVGGAQGTTINRGPGGNYFSSVGSNKPAAIPAAAVPGSESGKVTKTSPPSAEMISQFEEAWKYRNNPMVRGRIEDAWSKMTPEQKQQAKNWAKSKGHEWSEMKLPDSAVTTTAQVAVAPSQKVEQRAVALSQPVQSAAPQINYIPVNMGGGEQPSQSGSNSGLSVPPPSKSAGPTVPILPATNPDNFLVLYSRMVYNIVDG